MISFPGLLRWFSSPSVASVPYFIQISDDGIASVGLPHSAIRGSQDMCSSPWLFAAYHGLLRLVAPRHPPYTSIRLTILSFLLVRHPRVHGLVQACRAGICPMAPVVPLASLSLRLRVQSVQKLLAMEVSFHCYVPFPSFCQISRALSGFLAEAAVPDFHSGLSIAQLVKLGLIRVELMTPSLSEKCSNQLSYRPV